MKRFAAVLIVILLAGCGGDKGKGNSSSASGGSASRVRSASVFNTESDYADSNKLKQLGLAIHNYHDVYRKLATFPEKDAKVFSPKLSWRVKLLPFLEMAGEYEKFDRTQPWDSEKNKPLISASQDMFTLSNKNLICTVTHDVPPKAFKDLRDGMSNTIMFIENPNANGEEWTQPKDITMQDAVKLVKSLKEGEYVMALFYDGSMTKIYSPEGKGLEDKEIEAIFGYQDAVENNEKIFQAPK